MAAPGTAPIVSGWRKSQDARAAFDWLKAKQQGAPIGVIGISLGGAAALIGDDGPLPAQGFVLVCAVPISITPFAIASPPMRLSRCQP